MTIVIDEDAFSTSLSSLSTLSSQSANFQTLLAGQGRELNGNGCSPNGNTTLSNGLGDMELHLQNGGSSSSSSSSSVASLSPPGDDTGPYILFTFRPNPSTGLPGSTPGTTNGASNNNNYSNVELFEERRISLSKPCKIGRAVAKLRPEPNNAIFDCKVLSRNHALIWEENGKFYLQDTKSSNGTFLNGTRLGKTNEESSPFELSSGDLVQFGVDVTENTKKVTHGCITVDVRLFHKPGVEALKKTAPQVNKKVDMQTQELYQLALFLQEAMMREELLNQKLKSLQTYIDQAREISDNGWLTLIQEDRLLSRIDSLEKQSALGTKNLNEEGSKKLINTLREEKTRVENAAKSTIEKLIEEKNSFAQKFDEIKTMCSTQEEELSQLYKMNDELKSRVLELAEENQELSKDKTNLQTELADTRTKLTEKLDELNAERARLDAEIQRFDATEKNLTLQYQAQIADLESQLVKLQTSLANGEHKENEMNESGAAETDIPGRNNDKLNSQSSAFNDLSNNQDESTDFINLKTNVTYNKEPNGLVKREEEVEEQVGKLSQELELLRVQLTEEKTENARLQEELAKLNQVEHQQNGEELDSQPMVNLREELDQKNALINRLLASQNELLNMNFKNVTTSAQMDDSLLDESYEAKKSISPSSGGYFSDYYNFKEDYNEFKGQLTLVEIAINRFLEDRESSEVEKKELDGHYKCMQDLNEKIKEIKDKLESKEIRLDPSSIDSLNLTDAQKEHELNKKKVTELQDKLNEVFEEKRSYEEKLVNTELVIQDLQDGYDNLSLRTKIVSYVSVFPLFVLIIAIMIAFYPVLSTITATGL